MNDKLIDNMPVSGRSACDNAQAGTQTDGIPKGWVETTLGEIMNIFSGKTRPKEEGNYPVYGGNGIHSYGNNYNQQYETLIIGRVGAYCGNVFKEENKFWLSDNALGVKSNASSDFNYLYYKLKYMKLNNVSIGAAQPLLTQSLLKELEVKIPKDIKEQKAIADILTSFDDKIELLQAQNKTLETTAQTIFKEWFGKYQIDDELPDGWRVGKLGGIVNIKGGTTPSTKNNSYWNGNINWSSPKDLSNLEGIFLLSTEKKVTKEGLNKISSGLLPKGTLLLSSRAPVGYLSLTNIELAINQGYIAILPGNYLSNYYMYLWLERNMQTIKSNANGSTFLEISKTSFRNIECVIPTSNILEKFDCRVKAMFEKILSNATQIQTLQKNRDTLLPKLMSGELRIDDFKIAEKNE